MFVVFESSRRHFEWFLKFPQATILGKLLHSRSLTVPPLKSYYPKGKGLSSSHPFQEQVVKLHGCIVLKILKSECKAMLVGIPLLKITTIWRKRKLAHKMWGQRLEIASKEPIFDLKTLRLVALQWPVAAGRCIKHPAGAPGPRVFPNDAHSVPWFFWGNKNNLQLVVFSIPRNPWKTLLNNSWMGSFFKFGLMNKSWAMRKHKWVEFHPNKASQPTNCSQKSAKGDFQIGEPKVKIFAR